MLKQVILFSFCAVLIVYIGCKPEEASSPTNIVLIMTDDQGWGDLSLHGNPYVETPHINALAAGGTRFERFYVSPVCAPTRASLLTGKYHLRTGTSWVTHRKEVMRSEEITIAEHLKQQGYTTGIFGKWHNGEQFPNDPNGQGFDEFYGFASGHWNNYFDTPLRHNYQEVRSDGWIVDDLTDKAIEFIAAAKSSKKPFFCYIPYNTPHSPFQVLDQYFDKYKAKGLTDKDACVYGMVENIDDNVGRIMKKLEVDGILDNTIVIFMTDNGPNGVRYNGELRGIKGHVYEGGVRVPFIIHQRGRIPAGHIVNQPAAHIDVLPTLMGLLRYDVALGDIDGIDMSEAIIGKNERNIRDRLIYSSQTNGQQRNYPMSARNSQYAYVINPSNEHELYDLVKDPGQQINIINDKPQVAAAMRDSLASYYAYVTQNDPYNAPSIPVGYRSDINVDLPAHEATLAGDVTYQGTMGWANDYTINWSVDDLMTWPLEVDRDMNYTASILYSSTHSTTWRLHLGEERKMIQIGDNAAEVIPSPDRVPRGEVYEKVWSRSTPVELRIGKNVRSISLSPLSVSDDIEIKGIIITPIKAL